jgi:hypothetical protein
VTQRMPSSSSAAASRRWVSRRTRSTAMRHVASDENGGVVRSGPPPRAGPLTARTGRRLPACCRLTRRANWRCHPTRPAPCKARPQGPSIVHRRAEPVQPRLGPGHDGRDRGSHPGRRAGGEPLACRHDRDRHAAGGSRESTSTAGSPSWRGQGRCPGASVRARHRARARGRGHPRSVPRPTAQA